MFNQMVLLVPVLLPTLMVKSYCENSTSSGDVFVRYPHAEAEYQSERTFIVDSNNEVTAVVQGSTDNDTTPTTTTTVRTTTTLRTTEIQFPEETEGVVFVPNEAPVVRLEDEYDRDGVKLRDILIRRTASDVLDSHVRIETESPNEIVFVPGNNNDHAEVKENVDEAEEQENQEDQDTDGRRKMKRKEKIIENKLDCTNLDCNNNMKTICGGKIVNRKLQYRLFLNDCYFRKVNCNFKYEMNRYIEVSPEKCERFGARGEKPFSFTRKSFDMPKPMEDLALRRSFSSRRSMSMNVNGQFCSHPCPISCPEDYEPECAVSATGQRRVFMNHCKLDDNSCLFAIVWHRRPLSECVGGKKADMRQNRFFIGWMRQVGILDSKGKLVLE